MNQFKKIIDNETLNIESYNCDSDDDYLNETYEVNDKVDFL